jgi:hypothetical protein
MNLQSKAVCPELWTLLQRLMATELLKEFYLVGGTALALRYGHRVSVDLDLFTDQNFDAGTLAELEPGPICLKGLSWTEVKKSLAQWNRL